uniref:F-box domain-containing protein n=1 Tax=Meloidogyne hapla TaxID=6305 RepID=A0A1I8C2P0_MELHA
MNLPTEIKLDILQFLNYDQLFTLYATNGHFYYLISEYERKLSRMEFKKMEITASSSSSIRGAIKFGIFDLPFANLIKKVKSPSDEVKTKCQTAIDRRIPIYLCTNEPKETFFISLFKKG